LSTIPMPAAIITGITTAVTADMTTVGSITAPETETFGG